MRTLSFMFWLSIHIMIGAGLFYSVAGHSNVTKGISESLTIGITR